MFKLKDFKRNLLGISSISLGASLIIPGIVHADIINDEENLGWETHFDDTADQLVSRIASYKKAGMMPIDVDIHFENGAPLYTTVWRQQANSGIQDWEITQAESFDEFLGDDKTGTFYQLAPDAQEPDKDSYRLIDIEHVIESDEQVYSAIWVKDASKLPWEAKFLMKESELQDFVDSRADAGRKLIDVERLSFGPDLNFYSVLDVENLDGQEWVFHKGLTARGVSNTTSGPGSYRSILDIEAYIDDGNTKYDLITKKVASSRDRKHVYLKKEDVFKYGERYGFADEGYRLVDIERYDTPSGIAYAGTGEPNNASLYNPDDTASNLDRIIGNYVRDNNNIPGLSVAIIKDGEFIYKKGFGFADVENSIPATSETVYLAASVSKTIGGALAVKIQEEDSRFDLTKPASEYLKVPDEHTYRVGALFAHVSCIGHYGDPGLQGARGHTQHYTKAVDAAEFVLDSSLFTYDTVVKDGIPTVEIPGSTQCVPAPNPGLYTAYYSTPAYAVAAAVLENFTGESVTSLLEQHIFSPLNLTSMNVQFATPTLPVIEPLFRAVPYNNDNTPNEYEDNSWKILGGGIESHVSDVATFGWKVLNGDVVNANLRDSTLWSSFDSGFGIGWKVSSAREREVDGVKVDMPRLARWDGNWPGAARAELRAYRDDGVVIAIMSNRSNHNVIKLADSLSVEVLGLNN